MKKVGQTVSDKARKRIAIVAMLIIELKSHYHFIFLFFGRAFASSQMKIKSSSPSSQNVWEFISLNQDRKCDDQPNNSESPERSLSKYLTW